MHAAKPSRQSGFSFIEILVVMGIISVLVSMVVVLIPMIQEKGNQTKSKDNVRTLITYLIDGATSKGASGYPPYSGKNFVLSLVAARKLDIRNRQNVEVLFSPGDTVYTLERAAGKTDKELEQSRYKDITRQALKQGTEFSELTSYGGRRNGDREHVITADQLKRGTMLVCDDDDGPLHHSDGIVTGWSNAAVRFMEWEELDMYPPEDPDHPEAFLGDDSDHEMLQHMWGR